MFPPYQSFMSGLISTFLKTQELWDLSKSISLPMLFNLVVTRPHSQDGDKAGWILRCPPQIFSAFSTLKSPMTSITIPTPERSEKREYLYLIKPNTEKAALQELRCSSWRNNPIKWETENNDLTLLFFPLPISCHCPPLTEIHQKLKGKGTHCYKLVVLILLGQDHLRTVKTNIPRPHF